MQNMTIEGNLRQGGDKKQRPTRRDPEKRRQQNIAAQRRYREKLRERLENLEARAASAHQNALTTDTSLPSSIPAYDGSELLFPGSSTDSSRRNLFPSPQSDRWDASLNFWDVTTHLPPSDGAVSLLGDWYITDWDSSASIPNPDTSPSTLAIPDSTKQTPPSVTSWSAQVVEDVPFRGEVSPQDNDNSSFDDLCKMITVECDCSGPHMQIQMRDFILNKQSGQVTNTVEVRIRKIGQVTPTPDPYLGHLLLEPMCTLSAMDALRMHVGITEGMMCEDESPSPFYRPIRASSDDATKQNMVCAVKRVFETLKPDLRPSSEQITIEHPPFIDVLPFRTVRRNLILYQQELDEEEFLRDAVTGLVCWGGAGLSRKDRDDSTGYASTGSPWDNRSWEAKGWFLKKYWSLLGGNDGELVQQSAWWRSIRGEEPLVIDALA